ncbi:MAG: transcription elongation factor GreA [Pseudomonadota bacterium]
MEKVPLTEEGFKKLEAELRNLKEVERPAVIQAISTAREHGDLSENAEYSAAREKQSFIEGRIQELEGVISRADVIKVSEMQGKTVKFGATVTLCDEDTEEEKVWQIVGEYESDFKAAKIAMTSPIARALIGKDEGDSVEVASPGGSKIYEIVSVVYK